MGLGARLAEPRLGLSSDRCSTARSMPRPNYDFKYRPFARRAATYSAAEI